MIKVDETDPVGGELSLSRQLQKKSWNVFVLTRFIDCRLVGEMCWEELRAQAETWKMKTS